MQMVRDGLPAAAVARQLVIAESGLRRWIEKPGLTTDERRELAELWRRCETCSRTEPK